MIPVFLGFGAFLANDEGHPLLAAALACAAVYALITRAEDTDTDQPENGLSSSIYPQQRPTP